MNWGSVAEFFAMGGYARYVWGAYAVTLAVIVAECVALVARGRAARRGAGGRPPDTLPGATLHGIGTTDRP